MKPEILVVKPIYQPTLDALERDFTVRRLWTEADPAAYLREACGNVRAVVTRTPIGFSRAEFEALPGLEVVACFGPTYELIDQAAARERNVAITYTPDSTAEPVADLAVGMIIALMRRICEADRFVRSGEWRRKVFDPGRDVHGKTLGIVGFGRIGREIAKRASGFDLSVCYHGPRRKVDAQYPYFEDLEALARKVDCLVVTCPLTAATRNLVNARVLRALGPESFVVNVARGAVVDEQALLAALARREIAGAALDVFSDEPNVPAELLKMDNVVLTPHMGTTTLEVRERRSRQLLADLRAFFAGEPLTHKAI